MYINICVYYSHDKMWVKRTPEELIWGYDESLFDLAELGGHTNLPPNGKFGFFTKVCILSIKNSKNLT